jgi:CMP-N-acetylneuraminic acid synthetase
VKTVALIPIRAGSKGIPNKNMKEMCGKHLWYWVAEAALGAKSIDEVWVSTDYVGVEYNGAEEGDVNVLPRPDWLANDTATSDDVLRHFCWQVCEPDDHVVMLQATSPLTTSVDIDGAIERFEDGNYHHAKTLVSVVKMPQRLYWYSYGPSYSLGERPMRGDVCASYMENGALYISHANRIMDGGPRVDSCASPYVMPPETATEIDTPEDWDIVEKLLEARLS